MSFYNLWHRIADNLSEAGLVLFRELNILPDTTFYGQSPGSSVKTGEALDTIFDTDRFDFIQISVAWIRRTGVQAIAQRLEQFLSHGPNNRVNITFGCGFGGTSSEAIRELLEIGRRNVGQLGLRANLQSNGTFHPKIYFAQHIKTDDVVVAIGSSNLTGAALTGNNSEALLLLDTDDHSDRTPFYDIGDYIDDCNDDSEEQVIEIRNPQGVKELMKAGFLSSEKKLRKRAARASNRSKRGRKRISALRARLGLPDLSGSTSGGSGGGTGGGTPGGSGGGTGGGTPGGSGGGSGGGSSSAFSTANRIEMLIATDEANRMINGSKYLKIPAPARDFFPAYDSISPAGYDQCEVNVEFISASGTFTAPVRVWHVTDEGIARINVRTRPARELDWPVDGIVVITRLTSATAAYSIEVIPPTDPSYSTRCGVLDPDSTKNVTAFP